MNKFWVRCFIASLFIFAGGARLQANNVTISSCTLVNRDTGNHTFDIKLSVSQESSWRNPGAPSDTANWDALWVFVKYSTAPAGGGLFGAWKHCKLLNTGYTIPGGSEIAMSSSTAEGAFLGFFIYRSAAQASTGMVTWNDVIIKWDYGTDSVADDAWCRIKAFAAEMVYIPQGEFDLGDTASGTGVNKFYAGGGSGPFQVASENAIAVANTSGNLYFSGAGTYDIPQAFPKGYKAFYMMKYEISQIQYWEFFNTLTANQKTTRSSGSTYIMSNTAGVSERNGIKANGCDLDNDGVYNESHDGQWIACNYLSWADVA
ncbi:MAG: hypothetical protein WCQ26_12230, partial [Pseudanabaena sp. ELA748]